MTIIATLATNKSLNDLRVFLKSLSLHYTAATSPTIYIFADTAVKLMIEFEKHPLTIIIKDVLGAYSDLDRPTMELIGRPNNTTLWYEFQMEKLNLLDWVFEVEPRAKTEGAFYLDADICFLGPLPAVPSSAAIALSPHLIRPNDEARFGKYNGGFLWMRDPAGVVAWRTECPHSRFHEQAALECFDDPEWAGLVHTFPVQVNYGWWRMWQGRQPAKETQAAWTVEKGVINVAGAPLLSIHTHFVTTDLATRYFNTFVLNNLIAAAKTNLLAQRLLDILSPTKI